MDVSGKEIAVGAVCVVAAVLVSVLVSSSSAPGTENESVFAYYMGPHTAANLLYSETELRERDIVRHGAWSLEEVVEVFKSSEGVVVGEIDVLRLEEASDTGSLLPFVHPSGLKPLRMEVKKESPIESPRDLQGREVAVDLDNSAGIAALAALEERYGIPPDDIDLVDVGGNTEARRLLILEGVDAAVLHGKTVAKDFSQEVQRVLWRPMDYFDGRFNGSLPLVGFAVSGKGNYGQGLAVMEAVNSSFVAGTKNLENRVREGALRRGIKAGRNASSDVTLQGLQRVSKEDMRFMQYLNDYAYENGFVEERFNVSELYMSASAGDQ